MTKVSELERTLLDQIEKLNDDSLFNNQEEAKLVIEKSKAISALANTYVGVQGMKLSIAKELNSNGGIYEKYLGLEE